MPRLYVIVALTLLLLISQPLAFAADQWTPEEKLAKQIKPAVVRVCAYYWATWTIGNTQINTYYGGFGSGAFINPDGYIITNAHVVEVYNHTNQQKWEKLAWQLVYILTDKYRIPRTQAIALINQGQARIGTIHNEFFVLTPGGEKLAFDIKEIGSPTGQKDGKDVAVIKVEGRNYPTVQLGDSDNIRTGEKIFVGGYPSAGDLYNIGSQKSMLEWSWATGHISSDKKTTAQGAPLIQINAGGVTPGNSGGPVFNVDGKVIGIITFTMKDGANAPLYCMSSRTIQEFVRKAGADNTQGLTDQYYREGLNFYWQHYYSKALDKFMATKHLYPKHSEIDDLVAECQKNIAKGNNRTYWPDYYPYIFIVLAATLAITALGFYAYKRKLNCTAHKQAEK